MTETRTFYRVQWVDGKPRVEAVECYADTGALTGKRIWKIAWRHHHGSTGSLLGHDDDLRELGYAATPAEAIHLTIAAAERERLDAKRKSRVAAKQVKALVALAETSEEVTP